MEIIREQEYNYLLNNILKEYEYLKVMLERTNKNITRVQIDKIYKEAVKIQLEFYDCRKSLGSQIYERMKKILFNYKYSIGYDNRQLEKKKQQIGQEVSNDKQLVNESYTRIQIKDIQKSEENIELVDENGRLNLSFLRLLLIKRLFTKIELATELQISYEMVDKVLNGEYHLKEIHLSRLYKKYKTNNIYDLKIIIENIDVKNIINEKWYSNQISDLIKLYLQINNISQRNFARLIGYNVSLLSEVLNKKRTICENMYQKLYDYFKVSSKGELIFILKRATKNYNEVVEEQKQSIIKEKWYSDQISDLLNSYLIMNNISRSKFGLILGTDPSTIKDIINKKRVISEMIYQKLYQYFKVRVKIPEELILVLKKLTENYNEVVGEQKKSIIKEKWYSDQISDLLNSYLQVHNISQEKFANLIGTSDTTIFEIINKKRNISEAIYQKLYVYFKVNSKEKLMSLLKRRIKKRIKIIEENQKNLEKYSGIIKELLIKYLKVKKISIEKFSNLIGCGESTLRKVIEDIQLYERAELLLNYFGVQTIKKLIVKLVSEIAEIKNGIIKTDKIDRNILFQMVDVSTLIDEEYIIFMLLFGEIRYLPSIISELLNIKEEYVLNIYNDYLNKYMEYISKSDRNNNVKKLKADN